MHASTPSQNLCARESDDDESMMMVARGLSGCSNRIRVPFWLRDHIISTRRRRRRRRRRVLFLGEMYNKVSELDH
jgi:hypothetical protein